MNDVTDTSTNSTWSVPCGWQLVGAALLLLAPLLPCLAAAAPSACPHALPAVLCLPRPPRHRFSWNKSHLEKPRNEGLTQTNPLATMVRGVLMAIPTAVLVVASITKLSDTSYNK